MSTIASLISLIDPSGIKPWYEGQQGVNREQIGRQQAQTGLIELAELRAKQQAQQMMFERIQNDPELRQRLFGDGSILGSLQTAPGGPPPAPATGPITQSPLGGGAAQQIPASPDLSRFANVPPTGGGPIPPNVMGQTMPQVTPPQSVLGSLGPAGGMPGAQQGQMQAPQNPLLEMARKDPRAALMLQGQMQAQQDRQWKMQEQGLSNRIKVVDYLARMAQGATDQDSWTQFLAEADRVQPGAGARLPQTYSKEGKDRIVAQGIDAKDTMTLQVADLKSQREALAAQQKAMLDQQQHGERMGLEREKLGQQQTQQTQQQQQQTRGAEFQLQGEYNKLAQPYREVRDAMGRIEAAGTSPTAAGDAALLTAYMKMLDPTTGVRNEEIRNAENVGGLPQRARGWLEWLKGGAPLGDDVRKDFMERSKKLYEQYQKDYEQVGTQYREQATRQGLDPRNVVQDYRSTTPGGGRSFGKPAGEMSKEEIAAEIAAIKARGGR